MLALPTGTVTFLFTDIEGSTRLLQTLRDEYADALAEHRALLRNAFAQWNGVEVDTQGDSFFVAFERARDAVNAVADAQRALSAQKFARDAAIRVRMGLHTGEPQISDAHYVGMDVHRAARIMSAAHGGQVLVSQTTYDLIESELPDGVTLRDLGEHRLKDLRRPKHLYQLVIAGLQNDFPPIKSLDALPNNLPIQLTSFVGRDQEIGELETILAQQRLVTLTGVGGTGKTRLALQVAADVLEEYQDGVWLIELAPLSDPALVPQTVATALGLREQTGRAFMEMLQDYLRNKHLLLVLDNCEHLIEACAELADTLLHAAPHLKILATSRESLGIAGETSYPVRSLSVPDTKHLLPDTLSQYDAAKLFIDRAVSVQPNFQVTNENEPAVAQICARLDGIPLAIELAAARVKGLSVEQIASRLDDRFRLLTGGSRTALPRQRTLQAAIDWSYKLLSEAERVLLRRLSVFAGRWTVEAAEFVCSDDESEIRPLTFVLRPDEILDLLLRLVDKSLVVADTETSEPRYHMLETIRQYAQEKLDEAGEANRARDSHLDYFVSFAEQPTSEHESAGRLEMEHDNLRAAFEWSLLTSGPRAQLGLRLAIILAPFWLFRGYVSEGRARMAAVLAHPDAQEYTPERARALYDTAYLAYRQSDYSVANSLAQTSLAICRSLDDGVGTMNALEILANAATEAGDYGHARTLNQERIALGKALNQIDKTALTFTQQAWVEMRAGNLQDAQTYFEEALSLYRQIESKWGIGVTLSGLGELAFRQGSFALAIQLLESSLAVREELSDKSGISIVLGTLAWVAMRKKEWNLAIARLRSSVAIRQELGDMGGIAWCLERFAEIAMLRARHERSVHLFSVADALRAAIGSMIDAVDLPNHERNLAGLRRALGDEKYNALWAEGRALTFEQAIELAMSEQDSG